MSSQAHSLLPTIQPITHFKLANSRIVFPRKCSRGNQSVNNYASVLPLGISNIHSPSYLLFFPPHIVYFKDSAVNSLPKKNTLPGFFFFFQICFQENSISYNSYPEDACRKIKQWTIYLDSNSKLADHQNLDSRGWRKVGKLSNRQSLLSWISPISQKRKSFIRDHCKTLFHFSFLISSYVEDLRNSYQIFFSKTSQNGLPHFVLHTNKESFPNTQNHVAPCSFW